MAYTLSELDELSIEDCHALSFGDRDRLLDLVIEEGRHQSTNLTSYRNGLYCDYFDEDMVRMLKVKAIKVFCRGTTASAFDGNLVGETDEEQYRAAFNHVKTTLSAAKTSYGRVVTMEVFLTNMDNWPLLNQVYREFIENPPCRAVLGTTGLAQKPLSIEIVQCIAYRVAE